MIKAFQILLMVMLSVTMLFAQEASEKSKENTTNETKDIKAPQVVEGDVTFTDGTNQILKITDEGNFGAIQMLDGVPSTTTDKLYNNDGTLYFNGNAVSSGLSSVDSLNDLADAKPGGYSIFLGEFAGGNDDGILNYNTAVGRNALSLNESGTSNTAIGFSALNKNEDHNNVAVGSSSLFRNVGGSHNIAVGSSALSYNISGNHNTAIGSFAGLNSTGYNNIFVGYQAGFNETGNGKLYINNDSSSSPLIWGNFNTDSLKFNGNVHITRNLTFDGDLLNDSLKIDGIAHISNAFSVGNGAQSLAPNSAAFGKNTSVLGITSIAAGEDNAVFSYNSSTFGLGLKSSSYLSTVIGRFNDNDLLFDIASWVSSEPLFVVGNGTDDANRANALTVLKNGNTSISGNLDVNGKMAIGTTANASGANSFAIGSNVNASGNGTIFLGDNSATSVQSAGNDNRFAARFANGYRFYTTADLSVGAKMDAGDNSWTIISDSTKKTNFKLVDGEEILNKISHFNLTSWNYKTQDPSKFRHYGPMAQDFYDAFGNDGIGTIGNDTTISSADFDGINFIAIQALEVRTKQQKSSIKNLEARINDLEEQNEELVILNSESRKNNEELRIYVEQIKQAIYSMRTNQNDVYLTSKK